MKRFLLTGINVLLISFFLHAQVSLTNGLPSVLIDFSNTMPTTVGSNPSTAFSGAGFEPNPVAAGRLNANAWAATGFSDGSLAFGATNTAGDYARGTTAVAVTTGGIYAYTGAPGSAANPSLMIQPSGTDFVPGSLTLRIRNDGTDNITQLVISYNLYIRNNELRGNSFNFSYSADNTTYTTIAALDYTSPAAVDASGWVLVGTAPSRSTTITGLNITPGDYFYIRWTGNDATGSSGQRDEFGLDDISIAATFTPASTDFYRSLATGNWNSAATWETSPDNSTWLPAVIPPTSASNTIQVRNGHTVTISTNVTADQVVVENGAILDYTGGAFTVNDGAGNDISIQNGGALVLSVSGTTPAFSGAAPVIDVGTGGILRVAAAGVTTTPGAGVHAANFVYQHQSVFEFTLTGAFGTNGVTYFPHVNAATIPVFRLNNSANMLVGANANTIINGVFEANGPGTVIWQNSGDKIFRNGIRGNGKVMANATAATAKFIINGETAELGGTDSLILPAAGGLEIGAAAGTQVTLLNDKIVSGNISLLPTGTFVDLGSNNLTVTGTVSGGGSNSYIRTASTGSLTLNSVDATGKTFPVGHTLYNPLLIEKGSNHNWTARVNDGVVADPPQGVTGAVLLTWHITPSVNPPVAAADITFQFDTSAQTGALFNAPPYNTPNTVQAWHRKQGYWLAAGAPSLLNPVSGDINNVKVTGLIDFSPYALSRIALPLPVKLIRFTARKTGNTEVGLSWELEACCSRLARFEVQRSVNGIEFTTVHSLAGSEINRFYRVNDILQTGAAYYRLRITDADGSVSFSQVAVLLNGSDGFVIKQVNPSPASALIRVSVLATEKKLAYFRLFNAAGREIRIFSQALEAGNNLITVQLSGMAGGLYYLVGRTEKGETTNVAPFFWQE